MPVENLHQGTVSAGESPRHKPSVGIDLKNILQLVPKKIKGSGLEVKQLWEEDNEKTDAEIFH